MRVVPRAAPESLTGLFFFLIQFHVLVDNKPFNVPQPPQSEVDELAHRVLCIIDLCKDGIFIARRNLAEQAGRDPDKEKEIASANTMLSLVPMLRQGFPATASSNRGATSGDSPNPLKRDHDSMVNGTAVSLVPRIPNIYFAFSRALTLSSSSPFPFASLFFPFAR